MTDSLDATARLIARGAHLVLCKEDKRPLWAKWQKRPVNFETVSRHLHVEPGGLVGIIPYSLQASALDVDRGSPAKLIEEHPPAAELPSRRKEGAHLYYPDTVPRGNANFSSHGCSGEVRSARGFLILWERGALTLSETDFEDPHLLPFPEDLFEAAGVKPPALTPPWSPSPQAATNWQRKAAAALERCRRAQIGERQILLFDAGRFFAYSDQNRGSSLDLWHPKIEDYLLGAAGLMRDPLPTPEVRSTAWSIASWCWSGGGPVDHSPVAQARRGRKSGRVRRMKTRERDELILQLHREGRTTYEIAAVVEMSQRGVSKIINRDLLPLFDEAPKAGRPGLGEPWKEQGISRRTYFRREAAESADGTK